MKNALISVSNKTDLINLSYFLLENDFNIYSTGGTFNHIKQLSEYNIHEVSDLTQFPEILNGRVKTLHPKIYGGILANKNNVYHKQDMSDNDCIYFDLVVVNLYPFEKISIEKKDELDECIENIDIGGVSLIRASSKNYKHIILLTNPNQYSNFIQTYSNDTNLGHSIKIRKQFAIKGFEMTAHYDKLITNYLSDDESSIELKYGMNPHQGNSNVIFNNNNNPFKVLNGKMGFINVLDAIHGWLTVKELDDLLDYPAAISMKHTSLAGLAIGNNISKNTLGFFNIDYAEKENVSPLALAFMKSRVGDPLSSFGDFICVSREVDTFTANLIKKEVCDGIAAPSFSKEALEILTSKRNGNFIILKMDLDYYKKMKETGWVELKSLYGITIKQDSNHYTTLLDESISEDKRIDLILANTALKYAQSNNVSIAYDGQIIGMGCGQQNRVACVKIAGEKAYHWVLRQTSIALNFWSNLNGKRQEKINILYDYVNSIISDIEYNKSSEGIDLYFEELKTKNHAVMASDGFFPFPDNIQVANNYFIKYIIQPGGSIADESIEAECAKYDIKMYYTGARMFYH